MLQKADIFHLLTTLFFSSKPFEHEARIKDLTLRQAQLNALLGLDKNETQRDTQDTMSLRARSSVIQYRHRRSCGVLRQP